MPRLSDVPIAVRKVGLKSLGMEILHRTSKDNVFVWASALSYSWLLAFFPFIIFLLTLLPYIPEQQKTQALDSINEFLQQLPSETAGLLSGYVDQTVGRVLKETRGGLMSVGLLVALWAASGGINATMSALDVCYDVPTARPFYKQRPLAILLTIVVATLMLLVVALLPIGSIVLNWLWDNSQWLFGYQLDPRLKVLIDFARWLLALFLLMAVLNVVYHFGGQIRRTYRFLSPGAVFCVLSWVAMGLGFRYYIDRFAIQGYNTTYGTVGGVVILLFLMYLAAIILLVGAEINSVIDHRALDAPPGTMDLRPLERQRRRKPAAPPKETPEH